MEDKRKELDQLEAFKALVLWAKEHKIKSIQFDGLRAEFSDDAFQREISADELKKFMNAVNEEDDPAKAKENHLKALFWSAV